MAFAFSSRFRHVFESAPTEGLSMLKKSNGVFLNVALHLVEGTMSLERAEQLICEDVNRCSEETRSRKKDETVNFESVEN